MAFASAISVSVTLSTVPLEVQTSNSALGQETGIADLDGCGECFGVIHCRERRGAGFPVFVERRGPFGLNDGEAGNPIDESECLHLAQGFAECGDIAEIAAGHQDPVRHLPVELIH